MAAIDNTNTVQKPRTVRVLMWAVTEPLADFLFSLSNLILITGAAAVLIGTIGAIAMGAAREHFADERLSSNIAQTSRARAEAAIAKEKAAEANLALARLKMPRQLAQEQRQHLIDAITPFAGTAFALSVRDSPESVHLMMQIQEALEASNWNAKAWTGGGDIAFSQPGKPAVGFNSLVGIYVQVDVTHLGDLGQPAQALSTALKAAGLTTAFETGNMGASMDKTAISIQIGEKPL